MQAESTFSGCELPSEKYYYALHSHCENARKVYISLLIEITFSLIYSFAYENLLAFLFVKIVSSQRLLNDSGAPRTHEARSRA